MNYGGWCSHSPGLLYLFLFWTDTLSAFDVNSSLILSLNLFPSSLATASTLVGLPLALTSTSSFKYQLLQKDCFPRIHHSPHPTLFPNFSLTQFPPTTCWPSTLPCDQQWNYATSMQNQWYTCGFQDSYWNSNMSSYTSQYSTCWGNCYLCI